MDALSPGYLSAWASQIGFLSAFLGGFAATFLAMILQSGRPGKIAGWCMGFAAVAATAFIVAAVATTAVTAGSHPEATPAMAASTDVVRARVIAALCFTMGAYLLVAAIGVSGWLRSRKLGWTTSVAGVVGGLLLTLTVFNL